MSPLPRIARDRRGLVVLLAGLLAGILAALPVVLAPAAADAQTTLSYKVNFQSDTAPVPAGYLRDFGEPFGARSGANQGTGLSYGWVVPTTATPLSLVGNGRDRNRAGIDQLFDTFIHMQGNDVSGFTGVKTPGSWEIAVPNGTYDVVVAVGDQPSNGVYDSKHNVWVEGTLAVDHFQSTAAQEYKQAQVRVTVNDGRLTLDAVGGTNTKIDFVRIDTATSAPPDTTPPAAPANVRAAPGDGSVTLTWNANLETDLAGYNIFRSTTSTVSTTGTPLNGATPLTATSYKDSAATNGTNYFYVVQAVDTSGNKANSAVVNAVPQPALTTTVKVNFQDAATAPPVGYVRDSGEPYGPRAGANQGSGLTYGWVEPGTTNPLDLSQNGRNRNKAPTNAGLADLRLATLMQMQYAAQFGTMTPGTWQLALPDGPYSVTVAVGDASYFDSSDTINVEGQSFMANFVPTAAQPFQTVTRTVNVADGNLTIDALGGKNTKIDYVDVAPDTAGTRPSIRSTSPAGGATNIRRDTAVTAEPVLPNVGFGIDAATLDDHTVQLIRQSDGAQVPAFLNTSGGGDVIVLQPTALLDANTSYRFVVTSGVKDLSGQAFIPTTAIFTTGTVGGPGNSTVSFTKTALSTANGKPFTALTKGPDNKLYAATLEGEIVRFAINANGTLGTPQTITSLQTANGGAREITGIVADPGATASNLAFWVTNSAYAFNNAPDWTGKLTRLSGPDLATVKDYVVGLPRSIRDHETNAPVFGPDGALYLAQGASNSGGDPDATWGMRPEHLLTAAVLRIDLAKITTAPLNVATDDGGSYNPFAAGAPVTIYATGVRNSLHLVWGSNGKLYAPTNGSATGGNTPATPTPLPAACSNRIDASTKGAYTGPSVPAVTNMPTAEDDWVHVITQGGYYGHPNPDRCEYVFNGGNPTAGADPAELPGYPVGVQPDRNYRGPSFSMGQHYAPTGAIEYKNGPFGADLAGKLLVARYSAGDDIVVLTTGANGAITDQQAGIPGLTGFNDPVDVTEDGANGNLYVAELGAYSITLLRPGTQTGGTPVAAVDKTRLVYNDVQGGAASAGQNVTIRNNGDGTLNLTGLTLTGTNGDQFVIETPPTLPLQIAPGASKTVAVDFNPTTTGPKGAALHITTDDPSHAAIDVTLRGLGTLGTGGTNEPSLQWIFDTYQIPLSTGDPDPSTSAMPNTPMIGDEVALPRFVKAGNGPVTITPLAVFGPTSSPVVGLGWYANGDPNTRQELFTVPTASAQTLNPTVTGTTTFDPGSTPFGFWTHWPAFSDRLVFQDDGLNTFTGALPHQVRVYPLKAADGSIVADSYVVATEESSGDWNDVPVIVSNVKPVPGAPKISVTNLDGLPSNSQLVFNRIGALSNTDVSVHDTVTARVKNTGTGNLTVSGVTFTDTWQLANPGALPATILPGATLDLQVKFVATAGQFHTGTMTIASNDPAAPTTVINLAGTWETTSEANEPPLTQLVNQVFGYKTVILNAGQKLNQAGAVTAVGDEVLSPFWQTADTTKPVSVRQLASWRTQNDPSIFKWLPKGATRATDLFSNVANSAQSFLPPLANLSGPAAGTFTPAGVFELKVDGEFSNDTRNSTTNDVAHGCTGACGHHVRFFPLKDASGAAVPNTWILTMDYNGINYDYQDNVYLVSNMKPAA